MELACHPNHIAISKSKGIKIDWKDGHCSEYGLQFLRDHCPCATCSKAPASSQETPQSSPASPFEMYKPALKILTVEAAGNYALSINWSDGHNTGIYSFDYLRSICPCSDCRC